MWSSGSSSTTAPPIARSRCPRARRGPHRSPDEQQGPGRRLPGRPRRWPEARCGRDRQHRCRQPVQRRRHPAARRADPEGHRRHGRRRPSGGDHRALLTAEGAPAALRQLGRPPGVLHRRAGYDVGLPRLQPRGRAATRRRFEVHLHARDDHPGGQAARRDRSRPDPHEREAAREPPLPRRCGRTCAGTASRSSGSTRSTSRSRSS